ncbi:hypothetical protein MJ579_29210 [Klebsiella pneumoniae]|nr:hypothetical protein MJ579_29210 [Klebsiella pneumoniae]
MLKEVAFYAVAVPAFPIDHQITRWPQRKFGKARSRLGVGVTNLAYHSAKNGIYRHFDPAGKPVGVHGNV